MICSSNIPKIIARLRKWQDGLPGAVARALAPEYWTAQLQSVARATLQAQAAQWSGELSVGETAAAGVMGLIQNFTEGIRGAARANGAEYTGTWSDANVNMGHVVANQFEYWATGQMFMDLSHENLDRAKQAVREWVEAGAAGDADGKHLDERDNYDVETAIGNIEGILGLIPPPNPAALVGWLNSPERKDFADRIAAHIQEFMAKSGGTARALTPGIVRQWLAAVLLAWREFARLHLRDRLETELNHLTRQSAV